MTTEQLLDEAWHALFHMDVREIRRHLPANEVAQIYEAACVEAERVRGLIQMGVKAS